MGSFGWEYVNKSGCAGEPDRAFGVDGRAWERDYSLDLCVDQCSVQVDPNSSLLAKDTLWG